MLLELDDEYPGDAPDVIEDMGLQTRKLEIEDRERAYGQAHAGQRARPRPVQSDRRVVERLEVAGAGDWVRCWRGRATR
jgi:hypothetical protein